MRVVQSSAVIWLVFPDAGSGYVRIWNFGDYCFVGYRSNATHHAGDVLCEDFLEALAVAKDLLDKAGT